MKKCFLLLVLGLLLGGVAVWLWRPVPRAAPEPTKADAPEPGKPASIEGVAVSAVKPITLAPEVSGYGRVLDGSALVGAATDYEATAAAAALSASELARLVALHEHGDNASVQVVEAARAAADRDAAQLVAARARQTAAWGWDLARRPDLAALAAELASGQAALVRVDFSGGQPLPERPANVVVRPVNAEHAGVVLPILGAAPGVDAQMQGFSYLALWRDRPLPIGTALQSTMPGIGAAAPALLLPRSALVRYQGSTFVYVPDRKGGYHRRLVEVTRTLPEGIAVSAGVAAGDQVVTTGAQQLLAAEVLGSSAGRDD